MTAGLVGQDTISTFTSPVNGVSPIDANQVKGNDNTIKTAFNTHDADATIHFQSSAASSRPVAAVAGRKWMDSDTYRIYYDDGAAWHEIAYFSSSGGTITGNLSIVGTLGVTSDFAVNTSKFTVAASSGNTVVAGTLGVTGATTLAAFTATTGTLGSASANPALIAQAGSGGRYAQYKNSAGTAKWAVVNGSDTDYTIYNEAIGAALTFASATSNATFAAAVTVTTGGLSVSSGTTAVQALTATTGGFSGILTATASNLAIAASGTTTNARWMEVANTSGDAIFGVESSVGGILVTGSAGYDTVVRGNSGICFTANAGTMHARMASTGLLTLNAGVTVATGATILGTAQSGSGASLNIGDGTAMQPTWGFSTPSTIVGIDSAISLANASGVYLHGHFMTKQTVATTGSVQGLETWSWAAHTTGTVASLLGVIGNNSASGGGTTTLSISVAGGGVVASGSTVTTFDGVQGGGVTVDGVGSVVTTLRGLHAIHGTAQNSGTIGTQYGLYVDDLTQATTNYAIFLAGKNDAVFNGSGAALATTAVVGFPYIPTCAGTPTGVPTNTATGRAPMVYDTTNNKIWFYNGGTWRGVVVT